VLAEHFLREFATSYGRKHKELTLEALEVLRLYSWPGNVRELRNLMERIVIMNPQVRIDARHIPLNVPRRAAPVSGEVERPASLHDVRQAAERDYILKKLEDSAGNVSRTAEILGLERSNLYKKMRALGITPHE
jgi:two-component system nitrogen regulation response regulator NtrX